MRKLLFIFSVLLTSGICYSQTNIWGLYSVNNGAYRQLDLRPDFSYNYSSKGQCGLLPKYHNTGTFRIISDTIFLTSNDSTRKPEKYLFISHLPTDKNTFGFCNTGTLAHIFQSDTVLPSNQWGRLSDYEALFFGCYVKQQGYYNDGKLTFKIETFYKTKIITNYYSSGQVKSIEQYYKDRKTGDWYYYKENGQIEKIETYKRDKLRRPKKNAL